MLGVASCMVMVCPPTIVSSKQIQNVKVSFIYLVHYHYNLFVNYPDHELGDQDLMDFHYSVAGN